MSAPRMTLTLALLLGAAGPGLAQESEGNAFSKIPWETGPVLGDLGAEARVAVPEDCVFTGAEGTRQFMEAMEAAQRDKASDRPQLIGQFGVGFYSAFLVAERVEVISRAAGSEQAFRWTSDAKESFSIEPAERDVQGTSVILHLKDDRKEFLEGYRLRQLIERRSREPERTRHQLVVERPFLLEPRQHRVPDIQQLETGELRVQVVGGVHQIIGVDLLAGINDLLHYLAAP